MLKVELLVDGMRLVAFEYEDRWAMNPRELAMHALDVDIPQSMVIGNGIEVPMKLYGGTPEERLAAARWVIDDFARTKFPDGYRGVWKIEGLEEPAPEPDEPDNVVY